MPSETILRPIPGAGPAPIIIDMGKKSKKAIKRLRGGEGKLLDEVNQCIKELREANKISGAAQPIVVVVRQSSPTLMDMMKMKW